MQVTDIMALGGSGVAAQLGLRSFGMVAAGIGKFIQSQNEARLKRDQAELSRWERVKAATINASTGAGAWIYRGFAFAAIIVVLATIIIPLISDTTVHFYAPKEGGWWIFRKEALQEYTFGDGQSHIAIFPYQVSFCLNVAWFYVAGRPLKHRF